MQQIAEYEEKRFGTPVYEFEEDPRMPVCEDDDWALMAEARPLDIEHTVEEQIITDLQEELLDELIVAETSGAQNEATEDA